MSEELKGLRLNSYTVFKKWGWSEKRLLFVPKEKDCSDGKSSRDLRSPDLPRFRVMGMKRCGWSDLPIMPSAYHASLLGQCYVWASFSWSGLYSEMLCAQKKSTEYTEWRGFSIRMTKAGFARLRLRRVIQEAWDIIFTLAQTSMRNV